MATDIASLLTQDEIPVKLRCARCNKLVLNAFRLPCCDQSICEPCRDTLPEECPVCAHSPLTPDDCKPNKSLRLTVKAFLKNEEKKREKAAAAASITPNGIATPDEKAATNTILGDTDAQVQAPIQSPRHDQTRSGTNEEIQPEPVQDSQGHGLPLESVPAEHEGDDSRQSEGLEDSSNREDIVITTGFEQQESNEHKQQPSEATDQAYGQAKGHGQQMPYNQFGFTNNYGQGMNWNPSMMQQMMAMQNNMNAGNWNAFPMMGMNAMGMDPSMVNQMMGGMFTGNNNWGWGPQQQGIGGMRGDNMMGMNGNFNAAGGYGGHMANMNNGAGYNAQLMSQQGNGHQMASAPASQRPSHLNHNSGYGVKGDYDKRGGGNGLVTGGGQAAVQNNDFLPGDAADSRPGSPSGQQRTPSAGEDASAQVNRATATQHDAETNFTLNQHEASAMPFQANQQQVDVYMQDDSSLMYPQGAVGMANPGHVDDLQSGFRGRGGFRGRASFRGRSGRFGEADAVIPLTAPGTGQGVEGAPTGPRAMREAQNGIATGGNRGGRGTITNARGVPTNFANGARSTTSSTNAKADGTPMDLTGDRQDARSRSLSRHSNRAERSRERSRRRRERSYSTEDRQKSAPQANGDGLTQPGERTTNGKQDFDEVSNSRHETRRYTPDADNVSERDHRKSSHRSSRRHRERSYSRSRSGSRSRNKDRDRRHRSSRHHDRDDRSKERTRRKHRHRSRSPSSERRDADVDAEEDRSSRHHRHRDDRHRERDHDREDELADEVERDDDKDKAVPKKSSSSSRRERRRERQRDRLEKQREARLIAKQQTDKHISQANSNKLPSSTPTGPRAASNPSIPTGPRGDIPTGPRSQVQQQQQQQQPREFKIQGRGTAPATTRAQPTKVDAVSNVDAHAQEREARNRERLLKEQQRRGTAFVSVVSAAAAASGSGAGSKRRASGDGGSSKRRRNRGGGQQRLDDLGHDDDDDDERRAWRVEREREAARWE